MSHRNSLSSPVSPIQRSTASVISPNHAQSAQDRSNAQPAANTNRVTASQTASGTPAGTHSRSTTISFRTDWIPFTLRWYFLPLPTLISLILGIALASLCWYSQDNHGLGKDDGSAAILFGWRFTPTLVAVLYTQIVVILFEDCKRTEPFARLAAAPAGGAPANSTLLQTPKAWWDVLLDITFRRKSIGKTSWTLICSSVVYILALLLISPLSSALLASEEVVVPQPANFVRLVPHRDAQLPLNATRDTYFRTISALTRNISTSVWVSGGSASLPFWPTTEKMQLSSEIVSSQGTWRAETTTYTHNYTCQDMSLVNTELRNRTYIAADWHGYLYNGTQPMVSYVLTSADRCTYELDVHPAVDIAYRGGIMWSHANTFVPVGKTALKIEDLVISANVSSQSPYARLRTSAECNNRDIILLSTPWVLPMTLGDFETLWPNQTYHRSPGFYMRGLLCDSTYTSAHRNTTISLGRGSATSIQQLIDNGTTPGTISQSTMNLTNFQELALGDQWRQFVDGRSMFDDAAPEEIPVQRSDYGPRKQVQVPGFSGLGVMLGSMNAWNVTALLGDSALFERASTIKGRFFAENVRDAFATPRLMQPEQTEGTVTLLETRVIVLQEIGIALATLFLLSFFLLSVILWSSRSSRRPLNLPSDPGSAIGMSALLDPRITSLSTFKSMHNARQDEIYATLSKEKYFTSGHTIYKSPDASGTAKKRKPRRDWRPRAIHLRSLFALGIFLATILATLFILYAFSARSELYQKAFTYEADLSKFGLSMSTFAPISIGPTVVGIAITLWWDQLDQTLRLLQPYISMSQSPTPVRSGAGLTYRSKTWMGAAIKAARHRHWILFLVALGSTLCQVLTVSMSALFERRPDAVSQQVSLNRTLEARKFPVITTINTPAYNNDANPYVEDHKHPDLVQDTLYENHPDNWLYGATVQLSLGGPKLAWTSDEWNFVPVDLVDIPNHVPHQSAEGSSSSINVTLETTAMRARLACEQIEQVANTSTWLDKTAPDDIPTLGRDSNITGLSDGYVLPQIMFKDTPWNTGVINRARVVQCCSNDTDSDPQRAVIGHWSRLTKDPESASFSYANGRGLQPFVTKWIVGKPRSFYALEGYNTLFYEERPSLQAALCTPVIEVADSKIQIDQDTKTVQSYELTSAPKPVDSAWSDAYVRRDISDAGKHFNRNYSGKLNVTTSLGILFLDGILEAAGRDNDINEFEKLEVNAFNVRDAGLGENMDLMTYSMYNLAGRDSEALLNYTTLVTQANHTFQTFFQHLVNHGLSMTESNWGYEKMGGGDYYELGSAVDQNGTRIPERQYSASETNRSVVATVSNRIQVLHLNASATYLSIGIVIWLIATAAVVACVQRRYTSLMLRNVELLADVLVLIAGSDNLLALVQDKGLELKRDSEVEAQLGWFKGRDGVVRWGVEVVGGRQAVEWVPAPQKDFV